METADQQEMFYNAINELERDYQLYFGLKSIQKGLNHIESIYDHFKLDQETNELYFLTDSDLPDEIREDIKKTYNAFFFEVNQF
jgi:hypothetical protein